MRGHGSLRINKNKNFKEKKNPGSRLVFAC